MLISAFLFPQLKFVYGGSPLPHSWGKLLTVPTATKLSICPRKTYRTPISQLPTSIPDWLVVTDRNGNNSHLPNIKHLYINIRGDERDENALPVVAEAGKLKQLLGSLTGVREVWCLAQSLRAMSQYASYLQSCKLDELHICATHPFHTPEPGLAYPSVNSLHVFGVSSKDSAVSVLSLLMSIKPAKASIDLMVTSESLGDFEEFFESDDDDEFEPEPAPSPKEALEAFLRVAEGQVKSAYTVVSSGTEIELEGDLHREWSWENTMRMELVLKEGGRQAAGKGRKKGQGK